jgi:hypothetical protein
VKLLRSFLRFWYDFIIGDDWKIAAAVVAAVALTVGALKARLFGDTGLCILGGVLVVVAFSISLAIDVRPKR